MLDETEPITGVASHYADLRRYEPIHGRHPSGETAANQTARNSSNGSRPQPINTPERDKGETFPDGRPRGARGGVRPRGGHPLGHARAGNPAHVNAERRPAYLLKTLRVIVGEPQPGCIYRASLARAAHRAGGTGPGRWLQVRGRCP
jgi:hypothetical protein